MCVYAGTIIAWLCTRVLEFSQGAGSKVSSYQEFTSTKCGSWCALQLSVNRYRDGDYENIFTDLSRFPEVLKEKQVSKINVMLLPVRFGCLGLVVLLYLWVD